MARRHRADRSHRYSNLNHGMFTARALIGLPENVLARRRTRYSQDAPLTRMKPPLGRRLGEAIFSILAIVAVIAVIIFAVRQ